MAPADRALTVLKWVASHVATHGASYPSVDSLIARPVLAAGATADFRRLAAAQGVEVPAGAEADQLLERTLLGWVADARFGEAGYYRASAALDAEVKAAVQAFDRAEGILKK